MHLQIIVPFMQLTWKELTQTYSVETVVPIITRYHLVSEACSTDHNGNQRIELLFFLSDGYDPDPAYEGISHVMRKFDFDGFPPPDGAGNKTASVIVYVYNETYTPDPGTALYKKKSKMQLADAEIGVDPKVVY